MTTGGKNPADFNDTDSIRSHVEELLQQLDGALLCLRGNLWNLSRPVGDVTEPTFPALSLGTPTFQTGGVISPRR